MKILKLKLRGAIGIQKGLAKDEIEIDFSNYEPGLIALTGKNGSGKTTVMENLHPYRTMVSRSGSLQTHFYLKDSYRILEFDLDGNIYEAKILIDALTGGSEAYLICNGTPLNDGKLTTYDEILETLLGSQELFFNSVFSGQKSKGIAELKPADRRKLFYELLNLTVYEQYLENAKTHSKSQEIKLAEIEGQITSLTVNEDDKKQLEENRIQVLNNIADTEIEITKIESQIEKLSTSISDVEKEIIKLEEKQKANVEINDRISSLKNKQNELSLNHTAKISQYNTDLEDCKKLISHNQKLVQNKDEIEGKIKRKDELHNSISVLNTKKSELIEKKSGLFRTYTERVSNIRGKEDKLNELKALDNSLSNEEQRLLERIVQINKSTKLVNDVPCTEEIGNSCQFLTNVYADKKELEVVSEKKNQVSAEILGLFDCISDMQNEITSDKQVVQEKYDFSIEKVENELEQNNVDFIEMKDLLSDLDVSHEIEEIKEAETNVKILTEKMENIQSFIEATEKNYDEQHDEIVEEVTELDKKLDLEILDKIAGLKDRLGLEEEEKQNFSHQLQHHKANLDYNKGVLSDAESQIKQLEENKKKIEELNIKKVCVQSEIKDWTFLTKAFDKTGIPVLKLENSGIEITTIANELLSLFENKFRIVFETTSLTKDKKRMKETFNINIVEDDGVCEISNKSGGQQVWLETAIQSAISLVVRQQGRNIQTSFLDEKDGALDLENATSYVEMIRKAHEMSGVHNTFIITHRSELLDFIPQQIKLADGLLTILN